MKFTKMHGAGNDYVYVNLFQEKLPGPAAEIAPIVANRNTGIGGDGLILIEPSDKADARMRMYNSDGSEAEMCGNGVRCVAKYVYDHGIAKQEELQIETGAGVLKLQVFPEQGKVQRVRVNMGQPILESAKIPTTLPGDPPVNAKLDVSGRILEVTCVSMGNPHCITFVDEVTDDWVLKTGPLVEKHPAFPRRVNAEFIQVVSPEEFIMRVWERGSGETLACGTGASAVAVAGVLTGKMGRKVTGHLLGGDLELEWCEKTNDVYMTGPAAEVFSGEWNG
ncbi:diaminopimelate epimerase [Rubinisphaera margarita]|uniref:diaminopimelate epimerase n=1 Tax=Rubinisphaera margarita TaxID=2909586 RepID=UPI001EE93846|nr:diaminopimelate epimerase [Rubinisphaera margarita]MCG6158392.1 diaminopimelate epimerase [Rubinisphaera margarita]